MRCKHLLSNDRDHVRWAGGIVWTSMLLLSGSLAAADDASLPGAEALLDSSNAAPTAAESSGDESSSEVLPDAIPGGMRAVGELLAEGDLEAAHAGQQVVLSQLDQLLAELSDSSSATGEPSRVPGAAGDGGSEETGRQSGGPGSSAARESDPGSRPGSAAEVSVEHRTNLATSVWGHLPDRMREQMRHSFREQFLPEYEDLIEDYYEALAEQPALGSDSTEEENSPVDATSGESTENP
jgi:hypothetical protein